MSDRVDQDDVIAELDAVEIQEWLDSLDYVLQHGGPEHVKRLLQHLQVHAQQAGVDLPFRPTHLISIRSRRTNSPLFPGSREIERRLKSLVRWNAMAMVVRANRADRDIGGHVSTYASATTLYEVALNHFIRGKGAGQRGDRSLSRACVAWHVRTGFSGRALDAGTIGKFPQ